MDPVNSQKVFAASELGGFWRSLNGGLNWSPIDAIPMPQATDIAIAPDDTNLVIATGMYEGSQTSRTECGGASTVASRGPRPPAPTRRARRSRTPSTSPSGRATATPSPSTSPPRAACRIPRPADAQACRVEKRRSVEVPGFVIPPCLLPPASRLREVGGEPAHTVERYAVLHRRPRSHRSCRSVDLGADRCGTRRERCRFRVHVDQVHQRARLVDTGQGRCARP